MTTETETVSPAFASCEALFAANPADVIGEDDGGQVLTVTVPGGRLASAGTRLRLIRHATVMGIFYRLYPEDSDLAIPGIPPIDRDNWVASEIAQELAAAAVPVAAPSTVAEPERTYERTSGPVHGWFGLTYANFLVVHRAQLQSMPLDWQRQARRPGGA